MCDDTPGPCQTFVVLPHTQPVQLHQSYAGSGVSVVESASQISARSCARHLAVEHARVKRVGPKGVLDFAGEAVWLLTFKICATG